MCLLVGLALVTVVCFFLSHGSPAKSSSFFFGKKKQTSQRREAERRRDNAIDAAAITNEHVMEAADNEALHAHILVRTCGGPRSVVEGCGDNGLEAARSETSVRSRDGDESNWRDAERPESYGSRRRQGLNSSAGEMRRRDQELRGNLMSCHAARGEKEGRNGTPELATHLKQNADRCNAYAQMRWWVVSYVNLKLPSTKRVGRLVEQGGDGDQEDWNIEYLGRTAKGKGKSKVKGKATKGKGGDGDAGKGGSKGKRYWCEEMGQGASARSKKTAHLRGKGKNTNHQVDEDDQERHVQFEEETGVGTFDVCASEDVEENKNDAHGSAMSKLTMMPAPMFDPGDREERVAKLGESAKQHSETHEPSGSSSSGQREGCSRTDATLMMGSREKEVQSNVMHVCRPRHRAGRVRCTTSVDGALLRNQCLPSSTNLWDFRSEQRGVHAGP